VYPTLRPETSPLSPALPAPPLSFSAPSVSSVLRKARSLIHTDPFAPLISPRYPSPLCFARVRINIIPWDLRFLCFHTLTHSFATHKTLSHLLSGISGLFGKNTRGGGRPPLTSHPVSGLVNPIPFRIRTYEKTARNPLRMCTSGTKNLKSFRIRTYPKTPRGVASNFHPALSRWDSLLFSIARFLRDESWLSPLRFLGLLFTDHRRRNTGHILSARLRALSVSALSLPSLVLSTLNCRLLALSPSKGQPLPSPRTPTRPPPIYGIIPPHRGAIHNPFRAQGGFSD
jgi:hypothetical protein